MTKTAFAKIMDGVEDITALADGGGDPSALRVHVPETVDVLAIRRRLGLTQDRFAARYGFSVAAVRDWEQRRRRPEASARVLLTVIDKEPAAVSRALAAE